MTAGLAVKITFLLAMLAGLSGCADKKREPLPVAAPFASGAITLKLSAMPDLNLVNGLANSCTLLLLQAPDEATLNKTLASPAALKAFFAGTGASAEEGSAILAVDRYAMMPGQAATLHIDRVMDARHVALVAGYYPFPDKKQIRTFAVPVEQPRSGWWRPVVRRQLKPLVVSAILGARGFIDSKQRSGNDLAPPVKTEEAE